MSDPKDNPLSGAADWLLSGGLPHLLGLRTVGEELSQEGTQWQQDAARLAGGENILNVLRSRAAEPIDWANPLLGAFGPGMVKGFHGTPHVFAAEPGAPFGTFKNEAIGTGEGAQAYGWGHYVAGNPAVAQDYAEKLGRTQFVKDGQQLSAEDWEPIQQIAHKYGSSGMAALDDLKLVAPTYKSIEEMRDSIGDWRPSPEDRELAQAQFEMLNHMVDNKIDLGSAGGSLLEVHILPDEDELLDWDKPLSQQSEGVQQKLQPIVNELKGESPLSFTFGRNLNLDNPTGNDVYRNLSQVSYTDRDLGRDAYARVRQFGKGDQAASMALHNAGIPGIKYLDAGSRARGEGTYNYVIFDPSNLRIVARNGQRLEPVDHDPFGGP